MKLIATVFLLVISSIALSDSEVKKPEERNREHDSYQKEKTEQKSGQGITTSEEQERQEQNANQDFDPELDAIDDDLTRDEGIYEQ